MFRVALTAGGALAAAGLAVLGWRYSNRLRDVGLRPRQGPPSPDLVVSDLAGDAITLATTPSTRNNDWQQDGLWGLEHARGYDQVSTILERRGGAVVRRYLPLQGELAVGDPVRLDTFAYPADPYIAHGLAFESVRFAATPGDLPAWLVPGENPTWAVFVHGLGSTERECLRVLPTLAAAGLPTLAIRYRNDAGAPQSARGFYTYGASEWADLKAAVRFCLDQGARDCVLIGSSMGGAVVLAFLLRSRLADRVRGVVLDAPALDLARIADVWARREGIPAPLSAWGRLVARLRFGVRWPEIDYLAQADALGTPVLLIHGAEDSIVPVALSDMLAARRPDLVDYLRVPAAGHVRSWNVDPPAYAARLRAFLDRVGVTTAAKRSD